MIKRVFAPGCAMMMYKPELATQLHASITALFGPMDILNTCCKHDPRFTEPTEIINVCPGCNKRFESLYANVTTITLWELLAESESFSFPDYNGKEMTILDACPPREKPVIHEAIRTLIHKMNIRITESTLTKAKSTCCGDSFYPQLPAAKVNELMKKRTDEMPLENVVVYCVSCIQSVAIGGKTPRYLPDLLMGMETTMKVLPTELWYHELDVYIEKH